MSLLWLRRKSVGPSLNVDWYNPLTHGMIAASIGNRSLIGPAKGVIGPERITAAGPAFECNGTTYLDFGPLLNRPGPLTLVALYVSDSNGAAAGTLPEIYGAGDRATLRHTDGSGGDQKNSFFTKNIAAGWSSAKCSVVTAQNRLNLIIGKHTPTPATPTAAVNTVVCAALGAQPVFTSANASTREATPYTLRIGLNSENVRSLDGAVVMTAAFARALADYEIQRLFADPWQLFSTRQALWMPAAGGVYTLVTSSGAFNLSTSAASLLASRKLVSNSSSLILAGSNASLLSNRKLVASTQSFNVVGQTTVLLSHRRVIASTSAFSITGSNSSLLFNRKLSAATTNFNIAGQVSTLLANRKIVTTSSVFNTSGQSVSVLAYRVLAASGYDTTLSGQDVTLTYGSSIPPSISHRYYTSITRTVEYTAEARNFIFNSEVRDNMFTSMSRTNEFISLSRTNEFTSPSRTFTFVSPSRTSTFISGSRTNVYISPERTT